MSAWPNAAHEPWLSYLGGALEDACAGGFRADLLRQAGAAAMRLIRPWAVWLLLRLANAVMAMAGRMVPSR